LVVID
jgi:ATP-dependent HslUV protease subunit HslV